MSHPSDDLEPTPSLMSSHRTIQWSASRRPFVAVFLCANWLRACHGWIVFPLATQSQIAARLASDLLTITYSSPVNGLDEHPSGLLRASDTKPHSTLCRRDQVSGYMINALFSAMIATSSPRKAQAAQLFPGMRDRRQLELCLVNVQRVVYWAISAAQRLNVPADSRALVTGALISDDMNETSSSPSYVSDSALRSAYLDARLGAKAILTSRVEVGAPYFAYTLAGMQITGCLDDLESYNPRVYTTKIAFREALATLVEFDGMDSVLDASPRSSLTLSRYDDKKRELCLRVLHERIVPLGKQLLGQFPPEARALARAYISNYYSSEVSPIIAAS